MRIWVWESEVRAEREMLREESLFWSAWWGHTGIESTWENCKVQEKFRRTQPWSVLTFKEERKKKNCEVAIREVGLRKKNVTESESKCLKKEVSGVSR